jgi:hypothetical protein
MPDEEQQPIPNGIDAATGQPLPGILESALEQLAAQSEQPSVAEQASQERDFNQQPNFGAIGDVDPNDLSQTGWGIVFPSDADGSIKEALKQLLDHRQAEAGSLFKVFEGADGYRPDDTAQTWMTRHGVSMNPVDPFLGVPYYLVLAGSPQEIPFEFQYTLDIYWGTGRLHFDSADGYRRYAERVVAYETMATVPQRRRAALFATEHEFDRATQLFATQVARPLVAADGPHGLLGGRQGFSWESFIGEPATKETLRTLLQGKSAAGPPALLLTGSHGMAIPPDDAGFAANQGALVCQDWGGFGAIEPNHWFAAGDLAPDTMVHGLIHFFFACYSAGSPQIDTFDRFGDNPKKRAPNDTLSRLPQSLLEQGALATLGHIDRAWSYSFQTPKAVPQLQGFRDVIGRLLRGERLGQATDQFNVRWAALSTELAEAISERNFDPGLVKLANRWVARDDARNYVILGDPAVRLRVDAMAPDA